MEFDIGTLVYVVITVIALIVGILGKKKKPAGTGPAEGVTRDQGGSFLESFERAFHLEQEDRTATLLERAEYDGTEPEITEEPLFVDSYQSPYEGVARPGTGSILDDYERIMGGRGEDENGIFQEGQPSTETIEVVDLGYEGTDYFEIVKDFDAGTAIIYSAIINRVEY